MAQKIYLNNMEKLLTACDSRIEAVNTLTEVQAKKLKILLEMLGNMKPYFV